MSADDPTPLAQIVAPTLRYRPLREGDGSGDPAPWTVESFAFVEGLPQGEGPAHDALAELARGGGRWLAMVTPGGPWAPREPFGFEQDHLLPQRPPSDACVIRGGRATPMLGPECWFGERETVSPMSVSTRDVNAVEWWSEVQDARWLLLAPSIPRHVRVAATVAALRCGLYLFSPEGRQSVEAALAVCERRVRGVFVRDDFEGPPFSILPADRLFAEVDPDEDINETRFGGAFNALDLVFQATGAVVVADDLETLEPGDLATGQSYDDLAIAQRCSRAAYLMAACAETAPDVGRRAGVEPPGADTREFHRWLSVASDAVRAVVGDTWLIARAPEAP